MQTGNAVRPSQKKVAKINKTAAPGRAIRLGADLRIATAAATFAALREAAAGPHVQVVLDAKQVEKADAAGLQALLAGCMALERAGKRVEWRSVAPQLTAAAGLLGLADALGLPQ
jgi:anti-anti-sigma regulatory factor